jgi:hypothetical protein
MKSIIKGYGMLVVGALVIFFSGIYPAHANFLGSDNFNDNTVDTSKWGADYVYGGGTLLETNNRLEYIVADPGGFSGVERQWILNQGSYIDSWAVQLDVSVGNISLSSGNENYTTMALYVGNVDDPSDDGALIGLSVFGTIGRNFLANFFNNGSFYGPSVLTDTTSEAAAIRIAFDSVSKLLYLQYDADGSVGGYDWTTLRTEDVTLWNMTDASLFNVAINVGSGGIAILPGMVTADNFLASQVPEPATMLLLGLGLVGLAGIRRKLKI